MKYAVKTTYRGRPVLVTKPMDWEEAEKLRTQLLDTIHDDLWDKVSIVDVKLNEREGM